MAANYAVLQARPARARFSLDEADFLGALLVAPAILFIVVLVAVPFFPTTFLPPFNEGTYLVGLRLNPGVTLAESASLARQAEVLIKQVPEVTHVGRRSGRAELDEHAEGVHVSELDVGLSTVARVRQRWVEQGVDAALGRKPQGRPSRLRKLDGAAEARLLALACSPPPAGRADWTMRLLADQLVELEVIDAVSHETVRQVLKKTNSSRG